MEKVKYVSLFVYIYISQYQYALGFGFDIRNLYTWAGRKMDASVRTRKAYYI
jgi:hypothetical protein